MCMVCVCVDPQIINYYSCEMKPDNLLVELAINIAIRCGGLSNEAYLVEKYQGETVIAIYLQINAVLLVRYQ